MWIKIFSASTVCVCRSEDDEMAMSLFRVTAISGYRSLKSFDGSPDFPAVMPATVF